MKGKIAIIVFLISIFSIFAIINLYKKDNPIDLSGVSLIVVDDPETRQKGLSGRESLGEDQAMLFVFDRPDRYEIWMKDMKFPIDIIWLDKNYKIVHIEENISPDTYPQTFFPPEKSLYVLEANAGFSDKKGLLVGKILNFRE